MSFSAAPPKSLVVYLIGHQPPNPQRLQLLAHSCHSLSNLPTTLETQLRIILSLLVLHLHILRRELICNSTTIFKVQVMSSIRFPYISFSNTISTNLTYTSRLYSYLIKPWEDSPLGTIVTVHDTKKGIYHHGDPMFCWKEIWLNLKKQEKGHKHKGTQTQREILSLALNHVLGKDIHNNVLAAINCFLKLRIP